MLHYFGKICSYNVYGKYILLYKQNSIKANMLTAEANKFFIFDKILPVFYLFAILVLAFFKLIVHYLNSLFTRTKRC